MTQMLTRQLDDAMEIVTRHTETLPTDHTGETLVPLKAHELDVLYVTVLNAKNERESRRSMIDESVRQLRNGDVAVHPQELRTLSEATARMRTALDCIPDTAIGRSMAVQVQQIMLHFLDTISARDKSWH